jgi:hypothetical protein
VGSAVVSDDTHARRTQAQAFIRTRERHTAAEDIPHPSSPATASTLTTRTRDGDVAHGRTNLVANAPAAPVDPEQDDSLITTVASLGSIDQII